MWRSVICFGFVASKLYGVDATIIIFVFVLYCIVFGVVRCGVTGCALWRCVVLFSMVILG